MTNPLDESHEAGAHGSMMKSTNGRSLGLIVLSHNWSVTMAFT